MIEKIRKKRPMTAQKMAEKFGVSIRTVQSIFSEPREEYLASHTTNRSKPWEAMSMSRATWYRKGKPLQAPANPEPEEVR